MLVIACTAGHSGSHLAVTLFNRARVCVCVCVRARARANWTLSLTEATVQVLEREEVTGWLAEIAR